MQKNHIFAYGNEEFIDSIAKTMPKIADSTYIKRTTKNDQNIFTIMVSKKKTKRNVENDVTKNPYTWAI